MRTKVVVAWALVLLSGGCAGPVDEAPFHTAEAPAPPPGSFFIYPERIPLLNGGFVNVERGTYFAPVNRSNPGSGVLGIEVYRFKASPEADSQTPPIFFLHGGPSFAGLERALEELGTFEERWRPLTEVSDVVVVGQRGIGSSKPTTTIETTIANQPADEPYDPERAKEEFQSVLKAGRAFWEESGLDLSGFTVLDAAEDVNEIRRALSYEKIIIWGGSFGSHWGMALMRKHPEIIERVILRGMEGPNHTYDHPGHLWNVYRRVAAEAEASPELQDRIPEGGLVAAFEEVLRKARESPFEVQIIDPADGTRHNVLFDGTAIQRLARGYSTGLPGWPADVIELWEGDFTRAAEALYSRSHRTGPELRTASFFQLDCGSGITPERLAEQIADPANQVLFAMNWAYIAGCPAWDSDLGDDFRRNFETEIPAVIVHGTWDTSTPLENALELLPFFKNSKFVPVLRGPHGAIQAAMGASEEFRSGILHFAATGDWGQLPDTVWLPPVEFRVPGSG
jgi:pimeloyl-ACP methyl ester carboxylesterase